MVFPNFKILIVILLALLALPMFVSSSSVGTQKNSGISYNPPPGDIVHAPLSSMGLVTVARMQGNFSAALDLSNYNSADSATPSGSPSNPGGMESIKQNALRFVTDNSYFPQAETSIAVDPNNTNHVVGGFNDLKFLFCPLLRPDCAFSFPVSVSGFTVSSDSGASILKGGDLPQVNDTTGLFPLVPAGDPSVVPSVDGNFFYGSLAIDGFGGSGIIIAKSNPGLFDPHATCLSSISTPFRNPCWNSFLVFESPFFSSTLEDKPLIVVDRSNSTYSGSVYLAWDHFDFFTGMSSSYLARCGNDLAACTMLAGGNRAPISGSDLFSSFTTPAVDSRGNVYVSWCNYGTFNTFGPVDCKVRSSPPGGFSFGPTTSIVSFMGPSTTFPNYSFTQGFATEQFRTASIPYLAVDTSSRLSSGHLYFTIQVCTSGRYNAPHQFPFPPDNPGLCGLSSILFSSSVDGGVTWSSPGIISRPGVNVQPTIAVDSVTGRLYILYYTTQFDPFNHRIDVVASVSSNGGSTFHQVRVTSVSNEPDSDPNMYFYFGNFGGSWVVPQYGDYFQASAVNGELWVLFTANYAVQQGTFQTDPFLATLSNA